MLTSSSIKQQVNMSLGGPTCDSRAPEATFGVLFQVRIKVVVFLGWFHFLEYKSMWSNCHSDHRCLHCLSASYLVKKMENHHYQHAISLPLWSSLFFSLAPKLCHLLKGKRIRWIIIIIIPLSSSSLLWSLSSSFHLRPCFDNCLMGKGISWRINRYNSR